MLSSLRCTNHNSEERFIKPPAWGRTNRWKPTHQPQHRKWGRRNWSQRSTQNWSTSAHWGDKAQARGGSQDEHLGTKWVLPTLPAQHVSCLLVAHKTGTCKTNTDTKHAHIFTSSWTKWPQNLLMLLMQTTARQELPAATLLKVFETEHWARVSADSSTQAWETDRVALLKDLLPKRTAVIFGDI